mmetsp:Transcript_13404/g.15713  ORF Transcript_13404/g.15713 Transcript_13404/m.15713 type:complete len:775 (+) Transcript_13404:209-2533(+)
MPFLMGKRDFVTERGTSRKSASPMESSVQQSVENTFSSLDLDLGLKVRIEPKHVEAIAAARKSNLEWRRWFASRSQVGDIGDSHILKSPKFWELHVRKYVNGNKERIKSSQNHTPEPAHDGQYFRHVGPNQSTRKHIGPSGIGLALALANTESPGREATLNVTPRNRYTSETIADHSLRKALTQFHNDESSRVAYLGEDAIRKGEGSFGKASESSSVEIHPSSLKTSNNSLLYRSEPSASQFDRVGFKPDSFLFAMPDSQNVYSYSPISSSLLPFAVVATPEAAVPRFFTRRIDSDFGMLMNVRIVGRENTRRRRDQPRWLVCKYNNIFEFDARRKERPIGFASLASSKIELSSSGKSIIISLFESRIHGHQESSSIQYGTSAPTRRMLVNLGSHSSKLNKLGQNLSVVHPRRIIELSIPGENAESIVKRVYGKLREAAGLTVEDMYGIQKRRIGKGRFAHVVPAQRKDDGSSCAIKFIRKRDFWALVEVGKERNDTISREIATQLYLTCLQRENPQVKAASGIVRLKDVFETEEYVVIEMDLMDRVDLFQLVSKKKKLSERHTAKIVRSLASTIGQLQKAGIAHRDVKLSNIVFPPSSEKNSYQRPRLTDFGMAAFTDSNGWLKGRCGTPGYVAPEILAAKPNQGYENDVDMFSLGVICYTLLCGYEPFYGDDERKLIASNRRCEFDFDERDWMQISSEAKEVIRALLEKDPRQRMSPDQLLEHPWIIRYCKKSREEQHNKLTAIKPKVVYPHVDYVESKVKEGNDDNGCVIF